MMCAGFAASAARVTNTASAEMDRIAPMRWLMALKYSLLSGAEMSGSSGGLGMDMGASITYLRGAGFRCQGSSVKCQIFKCQVLGVRCRVFGRGWEMPTPQIWGSEKGEKIYPPGGAYIMSYYWVITALTMGLQRYPPYMDVAIFLTSLGKRYLEDFFPLFCISYFRGLKSNDSCPKTISSPRLVQT